uniref:Lipocalin n=1 Tax=Rhipicephalus appendiculatus TaxID=34631 RepID=A0A131YEZ6_RHIAP
MRIVLAVIFLETVTATAQIQKPVRQLLPHREVRNYGEPSQLLGNSNDLVLLLVSQNMWPLANQWCMKSKLDRIEVTNTTFLRTEYFWIPAHEAINGTAPRQAGNLTFLYDVIRVEKQYTKVNTTLITESRNYSEGEYAVQYADNTCMVIAFPKITPIFRRPNCALWVLNTTLDSPNLYRHCVYIMFAVCRAPMYNVYEYEKANCSQWGEPTEAANATHDNILNAC